MYEEKNDATTTNLARTDKETAANVARKLILNNENFANNNGKNHNDTTTQFGNSSIVVSNVSAKWTDAQTENTLERVNLTVVPGRLVAIIGPVGAGKVCAKVLLRCFEML